DDPAVHAADVLPGDLDVPAGDLLVVWQEEVAFGAADDEAVAAEADEFTVRLAVVEDGEVGDRGPLGRPVGTDHARRRLRDAGGGGRRRLGTGGRQGLADVLVGFQQRVGALGAARRLRRARRQGR